MPAVVFFSTGMLQIARDWLARGEGHVIDLYTATAVVTATDFLSCETDRIAVRTITGDTFYALSTAFESMQLATITDSDYVPPELVELHEQREAALSAMRVAVRAGDTEAAQAMEKELALMDTTAVTISDKPPTLAPGEKLSFRSRGRAVL